jgi:outer membrane receptor protein involved in Fe transport
MRIIQFLLIIIPFLSTITYTQIDGQQRKGGTITGLVIEAETRQPIEYANIVLFRSTDSTQITGTITNQEGIFELSPVPPGSYYVNIQFIGFDRITRENIKIDRNNFNVDLGTVQLKSGAISLDNVLVEGQRNPITYQIDRKVIDVNQIHVAASGTVADVLENIPSIVVDIEGNVSLRGSQNFTVLIDGRPSVLDAQDILQQMPASTIDNIEIVTNPSAKYDPEGSSGIINIITKKTRTIGFGGITNLNARLNNKYGGDALLEYRINDISANFGFDYNNRFSPGTNREERSTTINNITSYTNRNGETERGRRMMGLRTGIEYRVTDSDILSFGGRYGDREMMRNAFQNHYQWSTVSPAQNFFRNNSTFERGGYFYALSLNYTRRFAERGHQLISDISFRRNNSDENSVTELFSEGMLVNGKRTTEDGPSRDLETKLDYTLPLGQKSRFEAGYQGEWDYTEDNIGFYQTDAAGSYIFFPEFSHATLTNERQHALYSIFSGEFGNLGYQAGLRGEYGYRSIKVDNFDEFLIETTDLFPGLHTSYKFSEGKQVMASFTRRIQRPRGWQLEPFETWSDANNVRRGNPSLNDQLVDSYEFGVSTFFDIVSLSAEAYYRISHDKIEFLRSAYGDNITLTTFGNVGKDYSLGSELMANFSLSKFWDVRLMGNIFDYRIEGEIFNEAFSRQSFNWNSRLNNNLKFGPNTQLQVNLAYNSPSVSAQGRREGFLSTDLAIRQDLMNRALSLTLQLRNLFGARHEQSAYGPDFSSYNYSQMESPMVILNARFNINNFRNNDDRRRQNGDRDFDEGETEF